MFILSFFQPKRFLQVGGTLLLLLGIMGFLGILGPTPQKSIFHANWYVDNVEKWSYVVLGLVCLASSSVISNKIQKSFILIIAMVGFIIGLYGVLVSPTFFGANLENPSDTIFTIAFGTWALISAMRDDQK